MVPPEDPERPPGRRSPEIGLAAAGLLTGAMALYHFWLPYAFHWGDVLTAAPTVRWGLFILNASFSYLLLAGGAMSIAIAWRPELKHGAGRLVILAMAGYWVFNATYQVLIPMPMPRSLAGLRWAFLGFGLAVALLYLGALGGRRGPALVIAGPLPRPPRRYPGASR